MILQLFFRSERFVTLAAFIALIIQVGHVDSFNRRIPIDTSNAGTRHPRLLTRSAHQKS